MCEADVRGRKEKEPAMSKERERELDAYFEQLDSQRESLSQIYQRVGCFGCSLLPRCEVRKQGRDVKTIAIRVKRCLRGLAVPRPIREVEASFWHTVVR